MTSTHGGGSVIAVTPSSVKAYAEGAVQRFTSISSKLNELVVKIVDLNYQGENAYEIKTKASAAAVEYANHMNKDMNAFADALSTAISNISKSLGGTRVDLQKLRQAPITAPSVSAPTGEYIVDPKQLTTCADEVKKIFSAVGKLIDENFAAFGKVQWKGAAQGVAAGALRRFTNDAREVSTKYGREIDEYLRSQASSSTQADQSLTSDG